MASPLQAAISAWTNKTFGEESATNPDIRIRKLWEEMEEMVRAFGQFEQAELAERGKVVAELRDEIADVYLCLLAFGESLNIDVEKVGAAKLKELGTRVYEFDPLKGWTKVGG